VEWERALDAGRAAEVLAPLEASVQARPGEALASALLVRAYQQLNQPQQAAALARRTDSIAATDPRAQHTLALYYARAGNIRRAAELESSFARSPQADAEAAVRAALLLHKAGLIDEALQMGAPSLDSSQRPELALMLAKTWESRKLHDDAARAFRRLLTLQPNDPAAWQAAAEASLRAERFNEATALLTDANARFPRHAQLLLTHGVAAYGQRRFPEAARLFLQVNDLDSSIEQPYVFLGRMLDQLSDLSAEILPRMQRWAAAEKRNPQAPLVLAKALAAFSPEGKAQEREALLREAVRRGPQLWETRYELGCALEASGQLKPAVAEQEAAARLSPNEAPIHYRLSRLYARLNQPKLAAAARARHAALVADAGKGMQP
jgi:tetratricopeptide (TPR) repeat protein